MEQILEWRTWIVRGAVVAAAVMLAFLVPLTGSRAAFSATTDNTANSFAAGTVAIEDDDSGSVLFDVSDLVPGDAVENCIEIKYTGSLDSDIKLYSGNLTGTGLGTYLTMDIDRGTGGAFVETEDGTGNTSCTGFTKDATGGDVYDGTLAGLATAHTSFANGAGAYQAVTNDTKVFKFSVTVANNNLAQGKTAGIDFTWEAQNQ